MCPYVVRQNAGPGPRVSIENASGAITRLPGVDASRWVRSFRGVMAGTLGPGFDFSADGHVKAAGEENPRARFRTISPNYFASVGVPILAGRDFNDNDARGRAGRHRQPEPGPAHVPQWGRCQPPHVLDRPDYEIHRRERGARRIIGVAADVDDENVVPGPADHRLSSVRAGTSLGGHLFVHVRGNPYALVSPHHPGHSRHVGGPACGARGHAGGHTHARC